jgi:cell wall-associated NlpC family hydrolase
VRVKALSLPGLAVAATLLGVGVGLGLPALAPSAVSHTVGSNTGASPGDGSHAGSGRLAAGPHPAADTRSPVPLLSSGRLTSFSLPVAELRGAANLPTVAPLHGLLQADMIVVSASTLPSGTLASIRRLGGIVDAQPLEAAKIQVNGKYTAMLGVNPSTFRGYAAKKTAASDQLWQSVAEGAVAVSYTMGKLDSLPLGGVVHVAGHKRENLSVGGFATVGVQGVDAVVSDAVARSLGMPADNAILISAPHANLASLAQKVKRAIPRNADLEPLMTQVTAGVTTTEASAAATSAGVSGTGAATLSSAQIRAMLTAALSRRGMPYVWGANGPASFDCSGLVQWSFAQAGVPMPRVAADQARTGPAVPVSQLQPGDLLFYHTDPTDPGYISHVAIYIGNGEMVQAPEPGESVEIVPADTGSEFAGAVRVDPAIAASVANGLS